MNNKGQIHFDNGRGNCQNKNYDFEVVCHQEKDFSSKGGGKARNAAGKLLSNDQSGFTTTTYIQAIRTGDSCFKSKIAKLHEDCLKDSNGKQDSKYYECRVGKRQQSLKECDMFGPLQMGLELVFGDKTSPGFVCGITDAIVNDGVPMP